MDKYNFNFKILIEWMLPRLAAPTYTLRRTKQIAWLYDNVKWLRNLHAQFLTWGAEKKDEISWNCQTLVLETLLSRKFGAGIYIENLQRINVIFGWPISNTDNTFGFPIHSNNNRFHYPYGVYDPAQVNFIVWVPDTLIFDELQMRGYLDKYKMISTSYSIQTYTP